VEHLVRQLKIKIRSLDDRAGSLSGGNQQKLVVAKWLLLGARCLLLMDPTRGIDVGTKEEMYSLLRRLADQGTAIIFHSTDYDELVGMCDRVVILYRGRIVRELVGDEITEHQIVASSLNLTIDQTGSCQE
jgi:ribose transport system ATP-binding protein